MKGISRCEMNLLMNIPEAQQIIEAKFVELRLIFKDKIKEKSGHRPNPVEPGVSNIIRFPLPHKKNLREKKSTESTTTAVANIDGKNGTDSNEPAIIKIVDASGYRYTPEEEQVKLFMDYFKNHQLLRKAILDEFFLRILPYSNIMVK